MIRLTLLALALLSLAACRRPAPPEPQPARPALEPVGPSDFSQPMTARGNEPFWALTIEGTKLTLTRPDHPPVTAQATGARITPGRAVWEAVTPEGALLRATLYVGGCSDGMSDLHYPMAAEVELAPDVLRGCAAKTADPPHAPKP